MMRSRDWDGRQYFLSVFRSGAAPAVVEYFAKKEFQIPFLNTFKVGYAIK